MTHPDDFAEAADPGAIDILFDAAAPEKGKVWRELRKRVRDHLSPDFRSQGRDDAGAAPARRV
jgi:hypothetical protein